MSFGNITSANSTAVLVVETIFPAGIPLQQYATDQAISQDEITTAETRMGVDGKMAAGWVPSIKPVTLNLEASSPSAQALAQLFAAQELSRNLYSCALVVTVPALLRVYTWSDGVLKGGTPFTNIKKVLDATVWKFDFPKFSNTPGGAVSAVASTFGGGR